MEKLAVSTPKESIGALPRYLYKGPVHIVNTPEACRKAVAQLENESIVGIDTETRPIFRKGQMRNVALLQVASSKECFLFRLSQIGLTDDIIRLLGNPKIIKVGLSLRDDLNGLHKISPFTPQGFIDLQDEVGQMGIKDKSLRKIFANFFKQRISKTTQLSNWEAKELTPAQIDYAATDAYACLLLHQKIQKLILHNDFELIETSEQSAQ
ncbi:MAG: 3'-5' exonuclease domain-containing protein 2 [Alloprevotella sp.]|nr:3'-5' exonuclease domain-containing protein 2 [Alloprevotella sp.]